MSREWEAIFTNMAKPPSSTEVEKIERTITSVKLALSADSELNAMIKVYLQGSYRNRVNVSQDSDVDIGVLYTGNTFFPNYPDGLSNADFGNIDGGYAYADFKNRIESALVSYYGNDAVHRGNKAFDLKSNTYRVDADVVPVFEHRKYFKDGNYRSGVQLYPDSGGEIVNWPEKLYDDGHWLDQHYECSVAKNRITGRRYKGVVRILKKLCNVMAENGVARAQNVPGFLIECMVSNVPNTAFIGDYWEDDVRTCIMNIWSATKDSASCKDWCEVSRLKYLFFGQPDSKRVIAHDFIDAAWDFIGVKS